MTDLLISIHITMSEELSNVEVAANSAVEEISQNSIQRILRPVLTIDVMNIFIAFILAYISSELVVLLLDSWLMPTLKPYFVSLADGSGDLKINILGMKIDPVRSTYSILKIGIYISIILLILYVLSFYSL